MVRRKSRPSRADSPVDGSEVTRLLEEMIEILVTNSGFAPVKMAGEAQINRTTEPVVRFLLWLKRTPEAQDALQLALQRRRGKLHHK